MASAPDPRYGGLIWTHHALDRIQERQLDQSLVYQAITKPDTTKWARSHRAIKYQKIIGTLLVEAVVNKQSSSEWIVLTCWSRPASEFRMEYPLWERAIRWLYNVLFKPKKSSYRS